MLAKIDQIASDLLLAAERLEHAGWVRGCRLTDEGQMCLLGAIDTVNQNLFRNEHRKRLARVITITKKGFDTYNLSYVGPDSCAGAKIAYWNNMICKDQDEAVAKLREAAYLPVEEVCDAI